MLLWSSQRFLYGELLIRRNSSFLRKEGESLEQQKPQQGQSQEGISEKLKKLVVERVKGEEKPN
jgi:hypothetical protein